MRLRIKPYDIEVPEGNPFEHDSLDRKKSVEILARLIDSVDGPGVFGIDADWGNGKTTFLRMLHRHLATNGIPVVRLNAWESDYVSDPFTAIATELTDGLGAKADESGAKTEAKVDTGLMQATKAVIKARCGPDPFQWTVYILGRAPVYWSRSDRAGRVRVSALAK